jgi:RNA-binding protein
MANTMTLTKAQEKVLRALAHGRKPIIWIGQHGLTVNMLAEIEAALNHHELIKIKLRVGDREVRDAIIVDLCARTGAVSVQRIGNIVALYRMNKGKPKIVFPTSPEPLSRAPSPEIRDTRYEIRFARNE